MSKELIHYYRNIQPFYLPGWGGPQYSSWMDEQMSWKESCYIGDWSFLRELVFEGPDALRVFSDISVNSFATRTGQARDPLRPAQAHSSLGLKLPVESRWRAVAKDG